MKRSQTTRMNKHYVKFLLLLSTSNINLIEKAILLFYDTIECFTTSMSAGGDAPTDTNALILVPIIAFHILTRGSCLHAIRHISTGYRLIL